MLRTLQDLTDLCVLATDGEMGKVRNFLFDDRSWDVRYLVVDVGGWVSRRDVVLAVEAIGEQDWDGRKLRVGLSREQVRHSPDVDTTRPVTRQQELAMRRFYGWPGAFGDNTLEVSFPPVPAGHEYPVDAGEDPHLRSANDVGGYEVRDPHGELGWLEHFIIEDHSWHIRYLDVKAGDWLHCRSVLIPTLWVDSISWAHRRVNLKHA